MSERLSPNRSVALLALAVLAYPTSGAAAAERMTESGPVAITEVATNLDVPWALAFLPDGEFLVTERGGTLYHFDSSGHRTRVVGTPDVRARGQGGLLDVIAARDFAESREIFLSFSMPAEGGRRSGTALAAARLAEDNGRLVDLDIIFEMTPASSGGRHFGSRIVEAPDGTLMLTIGDRGERDSAQDLARHGGKIIRMRRDGGVPGDNPLAGREGALPEIWSWGHRNPQGAALDAAGVLWAVEHGAKGGDEINRIAPGRNYGWPVISYGRHYSGARIGEGVAKPGMEQPEFHWDPSIAPSGLAIYSGRLRPEWRGHFLVGSLKFDLISRLDPNGGFREAERLDFPETDRVRDVREAPDGSIWFLSEGHGSVFRMLPLP